MSNYLFSGSAIDRVEQCPASVALDGARTTGPYAEDGTSVHTFLESSANGQVDALSKVPDHLQEKCRNIDLSKYLDKFEWFQTEVTFSWNFRTFEVKYRGASLNRDYHVEDDEIPCTLDLVGRLRTGELCVIDYKNGLSVGPLSKAWQFRFGARCVTKHYGDTSKYPQDNTCLAVAVYIDEHGNDTPVTYLYSKEELELVDFELEGIVNQVIEVKESFKSGNRLVVKPGDHCKYCPAFYSCHYQTGLVKSFVPELADIEERFALLTPEQMGQAWLKLKEIEKITEKVSDAIKNAVKRGPIPTRPGKALKMFTQSYSFFDKKGALDKLRELGVTEDDIKSLTKTGQAKPFTKEVNVK